MSLRTSASISVKLGISTSMPTDGPAANLAPSNIHRPFPDDNLSAIYSVPESGKNLDSFSPDKAIVACQVIHHVVSA